MVRGSTAGNQAAAVVCLPRMSASRRMQTKAGSNPTGYRLCRHQAKHDPGHRVHSPRLSSGFTEASEHARTDAAIKLPDPRMRYRLGPNRRFLP